MSDPEPADRPRAREYVVFSVAGQEYCIPIRAVREIRGWTPVTRLPRTPHYVMGVVNLRGVVLPVIDFAARLGVGETEPTARRPTMIVEAAGQQIGLLVEAVNDILAASEEHLKATPAAAGLEVPDVVTGLIVIGDRMLRIVNPENISARVGLETA